MSARYRAAAAALFVFALPLGVAAQTADLIVQKQTLEMQRSEDMVNPGHPLRHSHVIRVLPFELEFEK